MYADDGLRGRDYGKARYSLTPTLAIEHAVCNSNASEYVRERERAGETSDTTVDARGLTWCHLGVVVVVLSSVLERSSSNSSSKTATKSV